MDEEISLASGGLTPLPARRIRRNTADAVRRKNLFAREVAALLREEQYAPAEMMRSVQSRMLIREQRTLDDQLQAMRASYRLLSRLLGWKSV